MRPDADRCDVGQDAVLHYNKMLEARGAENYVVHYHSCFFCLGLGGEVLRKTQ